MKKVLVVDDEESIRECLEDLLKDNEYDVSSCSSVKSALEYLSQNRIDIIVSDFDMPDGTGIQLFDAIDANPEYQGNNIRKVLITAHLEKNMPKRNYDAFVKKPYIEDLLQAIRGGVN